MHFTSATILSALALVASSEASIARPWAVRRTSLWPAPPAAAKGEFGGIAGQIQGRTWGSSGNGSAPPPPPPPPSNGTGGGSNGGGSTGGGSTGGGSTGGGSSGNPADQVTVVQVGQNGQLTFNPPNVQVPVGSHVQFQFHPENHSVVQASFDAPCVPINNVDKTVAGFFSGFMPAAVTKNTLVFDYKVTSADPVWFYCSQDTHCQGGMVGAINAANTGPKGLGAFKAAAAKAKNNITPGSAPAGVNPPPGTGATGTGSGAPPANTGGSNGGGSTGGGSTGGGSTGGGNTGGGNTPPPPKNAGTKAQAGGSALALVALVAAWML